MVKQKKAIFYVLLIIILAGIVSIIKRCFYGIETTDEAYYIANANLILQGNTPIATIWTFQSGSLIIYTWLLGLYKFFVPDLVGVFLYMRICFTIFRLVILIYAYFSLKKVIGDISALCACAVLVPYYGLINQFSYVTCAENMLVLTGIIVFNAVYSTKKRQLYWGMAGITVALAICSHPSMIINALFIVLVCCVLSDKKICSMISVIAGGLGTAAAILIWIVISEGGIGNLIFSINHLMTTPSQNTKPDKMLTIIEAMEALEQEISSWPIFGQIFAIIAFLVIVIKKTNIIKILQQCFTIGIMAWFISKVFSQLSMQAEYGLNGEGLNVCFGVWVGIASITIFLINKKDWLNMTVFLAMCCPSIIFAISNGMLTGGGLYGRLGSIIPAGMGLIIMLVHNLEEIEFPVNISYGSGILVFLAGMIFILVYDYAYVYRDNPIAELNYKVEEGIYKGIYTTQINAESLPEIEETIREYTKDCNTIKAMDCAPEAYLMTDAEALTPTTWDDMHYADGKNDPSYVYDYFKFMDDIPDAIVYVASPGKPNPSIFQEGYLFNEFVNEKYEQIYYNSYGNLDYELVIYKRKAI